MRIKVIATQGHATLVQWLTFDDVLKRAVVPTKFVDGDYCEKDILDAGAPYGDPWEEAPLKSNAKLLALELHKIGIWTVEDLRAKPNEALGAIMACSVLDYHSLLAWANRLKRSGGEM